MAEKVEPQDFEMHEADGKTIVVDVFDASDQPADLTGGTCRIGVAKSATAVNIFENAGTIEQGADINGNPITTLNRVRVPINSADTVGLRGVHYWEVEVVSASSVPSTVMYGSVFIRPATLN